MKHSLLLAAVAASMAASGQVTDTTPGLDPSQYGKRAIVRVTPGRLADGESAENFVLPLRLSKYTIAGFDYSKFASGGADLAVTDSGGDVLPIDVDSWNPGSAESESVVWVRVPRLAADTELRLYWNGPEREPSASEVWDGYAGVWHMQESGSAAVADATGHGLAATPASPTDTLSQMSDATGVFGNARMNQTGTRYGNDERVKNYLSVQSAETLQSLGDKFTVSGWFKANDVLDGYPRLLSRKNDAGAGEGWECEIDAGGGRLNVRGCFVGEATDLYAPIPDRLAAWTLLTLAYDGDSLSVYTNGALSASGAISAATQNGKPLSIGNNSNGSEVSFNGAFDEVRIMGGARDAALVALDWRVATEPGFLSYSAAMEPAAKIDAARYAKSAQISVKAGKIAGGESFADFPLPVRISESSIDGFLYADAAEGGADVVFTDANGEILASQIDTWNAGGESVAWVKVPSLTATTRIVMHWGGPDATDRSAEVWGDYLAVWHFGESDGSADAADATGHGLDAAPATTTDTLSQMSGTAGVFGAARMNQTDSSARNRLSVPSYDEYALGGNFTVSGWFKSNDGDFAGAPRLLSRKTGADASNGWEIEGQNGSTSIYCRGASLGDPNVAVGDAGWAGVSVRVDEISSSSAAWAHIALVYDGSALSAYVNGEKRAVGKIVPATDNSLPLAIGNNAAGTETSFNGAFDEVRLMRRPADAARIALEYRAASEPDFLEFWSAYAPFSPTDYAKTAVASVSAGRIAEGASFAGYPALVRISPSRIEGFVYDDCADGAGLAFTDADGTLLPHEIDTWNASGESLVWVRVPELSAATTLNVYWNGPARKPQGAAVWAGYAGVWHMNGDGAATVPDATGHGLDAEPATTTDTLSQMAAVEGVFGTARLNRTDSGARNYLSIPSYDSLGLGGRFTASGWFKATDLDFGGTARILSRKNDAGANEGWEIEIPSGSTTMKIRGSQLHIPVDGTWGGYDVNAPGLASGWTHLAFTFDDAELAVYVNGEKAGESAVYAATDNGRPLSIGNNSNGTETSFKGAFDEVRLSGGARPADEIALDFAMAKDADFFTFGEATAPIADAPVFAEPEWTVSANGYAALVVDMLSGRANGVSVAFGDVEVPVSAVPVEGRRRWTVEFPDEVAEGTTCAVSIEAECDDGAVTVPCGTFYAGTPQVRKGEDAEEAFARPGRFIVSRARADGVPLSVSFVLGGDAVAGVDYVAPASCTAVIPAGETQTEVKIVPLPNRDVAEDIEVTIAVVPGNYWLSGAAPSASLTIRDAPVPTRKDFRRRIRFTFPAECIGDATLADFPALIRLSSTIPGFSYSTFRQSGGADMMFIDGTGTALAHEIDTWDEAGESLVWVRIPELKRGTEIWMHYGTEFDLRPLVGTSVWDGRYLGVWHMNEEDGGAAADATRNAVHAVPAGNRQDAMASCAGRIGLARVNQTSNKTDTGEANCLLADAPDAFNEYASFAVSGWFRANSVADCARLFARRGDYANPFGFEVEMSASPSALAMRGSGVAYDLRAEVPDLTKGWTHLLFEFDGTSGAIYANGGLAASGTVGEALPTSLPFAIGNNSVCNEAGFNGAYDEVRYRAGAVGAAWAAAEWATVADGSFATASASQPTVGGLIFVVR